MHQHEQPAQDDADEIGEAASQPTRRQLALLIVGLVMVIALIATVQNNAMSVLDKLLPLATMIVGFFFGHQIRRV